MLSRIASFIEKYNWPLLAFAVLVLTVLAVILGNPDNRIALLVTILGTCLTINYTIQQHKLKYLEQFEKLFSNFNRRYDDLLPELEKILQNKLNSDEQHNTLNKYFNLCAEEYLFYTKGLIEKCVWDSWKIGIQAYLKNDNFLTFYKNEVSPFRESYYYFPDVFPLRNVAI